MENKIQIDIVNWIYKNEQTKEVRKWRDQNCVKVSKE